MHLFEHFEYANVSSTARAAAAQYEPDTRSRLLFGACTERKQHRCDSTNEESKSCHL